MNIPKLLQEMFIDLEWVTLLSFFLLFLGLNFLIFKMIKKKKISDLSNGRLFK